ncbi:Hypothetical protein R9X50_00769800 [Acrodontium crateriforme]|uniref:Wax synthase domain-containing protein n=1 Tax=Acrodontium crateriforme TaxID=150365 RepID=A0AAQ3ME34_9PEZI|nr:Hypothetical protein R9X50_00769800 [Acrodontium crateriforme]
MSDKLQAFTLPPLRSLIETAKLGSPLDEYVNVLPAGTAGSLQLLAAQQLIIIYALGFTKKGSVLRQGLFLPMLLTCLLGLNIYRQHPITSSAVYMIAVPLGAASQIFQYISLVLIKGWNFEDREKIFPSANPSQNSSSWFARAKFGLFAAYSFRHCGSPYEVGGVAQFKDNKIPTRMQFLKQTGSIVAIMFLIMDLVAYLSGTDENPAFAQSRVPFFSRLNEVTFAEVVERMVVVTLLFASNIAMLTIFIGATSLVSVASGLSDPIRWKPIFNYDHGFPYSVRRFWSHFWHVSMKDRIYTPSKYVADDVLGLPKGSLTRRYALIVLTFVASGLFHVIGEVGAGADFWEDGSFIFYVAQAFAIMAEDFVCHLYKQVTGNENSGKKKAALTWELWVGRVWLFLWLTWITPSWFYPMNRLTSGIPVFPIPSPAKAIFSLFATGGSPMSDSMASSMAMSNSTVYMTM